MPRQTQDSNTVSLVGWHRFWPLLCLIPLMGWWMYGLTDLDEGFYGAVAMDMMLRGDYITPSLNGVPWFEKPILVYWMAIPAIQLFGQDWGPRLPSVVMTLVTAWMLWKFATKHFGEATGILAALAYSSSLLAVAIGRMMLTDATFVATLTACFILFWESINGRPALRWGAAACLGLAVLAKSPVAGFFFIVTAAIIYFRFPNLRQGYKGHWFGPIILGLGIIAAWYVPCLKVNGDVFVQKYLVEQNLGRFAGGDLAHRVPLWLHPLYYPIVLAAGLLPWLVGAIKQGLFKREPAESDHATLIFFLWTWALAIFAVFSISGSKLPHYIAPSLPPLVLLAARAVMKKPGLEIGRLMVPAAVWAGFICLAANFGFMYEYNRQKGPEVHALARKLSELKTPIVLYRFGRDSSDVEIKLTINETSKPSLFFYLKSQALKTGSFDEVLTLVDKEFIILTPRERLTKEDIQRADAAGMGVEEMDLSTDNYQVFRFTPLIVQNTSAY